MVITASASPKTSQHTSEAQISLRKQAGCRELCHLGLHLLIGIIPQIMLYRVCARHSRDSF